MHYSIDEIPTEMDLGEIQTKAFEGGGVLTRHIDLPAGTDFTPLFVGLPGDLCQCPHWGYVVEGSINVRYADGREETSRAGDVYYWPGGHTGWTDEGVVFLEFSLEADIRPVLDHLLRQLTPAS